MQPRSFYAVLVAPFLFASVACGGSGGDSAAEPLPSADAGAASAADASPSTSSDSVADGGAAAVGSATPGATVAVHGTVTSYSDVPIAGRTVRIVDAKGARFDVVTDSAGGFVVPGVVTPYDVRVSPEGLTDGATIYFGIKDVAPYLHGEIATAQTWATQTFNVGVLLATACAGCAVDFVTKSPHGAGGASTSFPAGSSVANAVLQHQFVSDGSPSEPVTIHVLVHDAARTWFRYAEASLTAVAGRTSPGGLYTPDLVPVHPFTVSVQSAGVPANWQSELLATVMFADGAGINMLDTRGQASLSTNMPVIPSAAPSAYAWLMDPIGDSDATISDNVQAWSGTLLGASPSVVLTARGPVHDVVPAPHATVSLKGPGVSWTALPSTVTNFLLIDVAASRGVVTVFTDGGNVTWDRLDALGIAVSPGEQLLEIRTTPDADLAAFIAGDATKRKSLDRSVAGSASSQSWRFTLTP